MKKYLYKITSLILILIAAFSFSACSATNEVEKSNYALTIYTTTEESDLFYDLVKKFNRYCHSHYDESYRIKIVEFENENEMYSKMATEIMAGKGPDIVSIHSKLPFEKLINQDLFLDINELIKNDKSDDALNINNYNTNVLKAGNYNGKQYILPLFFSPNILITTKESLNSFNIDKNTVFTYDVLSSTLNNYLNKDTAFLESTESLNSLLYTFIDSFVDFENQTLSLNSKEFADNLDIIVKLIKEKSYQITSYDEYYTMMADKKVLFYTGQFIGERSAIASVMDYYSILKQQGLNPVMKKGITKDESTVSAFIDLGFAVNKNTVSKEKTLTFIKYALSDLVQESWVGIPVNTKAYENQIKDAETETGYHSSTPIGLDNNFMKDYFNIVNNINTCYLEKSNTVSRSYYNSTVIGSIVENYLNDNISKEKFIRQLTSATELYIDE